MVEVVRRRPAPVGHASEAAAGVDAPAPDDVADAQLLAMPDRTGRQPVARRPVDHEVQRAAPGVVRGGAAACDAQHRRLAEVHPRNCAAVRTNGLTAPSCPVSSPQSATAAGALSGSARRPTRRACSAARRSSSSDVRVLSTPPRPAPPAPRLGRLRLPWRGRRRPAGVLRPGPGRRRRRARRCPARRPSVAPVPRPERAQRPRRATAPVPRRPAAWPGSVPGRAAPRRCRPGRRHRR